MSAIFGRFNVYSHKLSAKLKLAWFLNFLAKIEKFFSYKNNLGNFGPPDNYSIKLIFCQQEFISRAEISKSHQLKIQVWSENLKYIKNIQWRECHFILRVSQSLILSDSAQSSLFWLIVRSRKAELKIFKFENSQKLIILFSNIENTFVTYE